MKEEFKDCTIGSLVISALLLLITVIVTLFSKDKSWELVVIIPIMYFVFSIILYGILFFSRSQLERSPFIFVAATIFVTGGGWWAAHALAFINVKLTEAISIYIDAIN